MVRSHHGPPCSNPALSHYIRKANETRSCSGFLCIVVLSNPVAACPRLGCGWGYRGQLGPNPRSVSPGTSISKKIATLTGARVRRAESADEPHNLYGIGSVSEIFPRARSGGVWSPGAGQGKVRCRNGMPRRRASRTVTQRRRVIFARRPQLRPPGLRRAAAFLCSRMLDHPVAVTGKPRFDGCERTCLIRVVPRTGSRHSSCRAARRKTASRLLH